MGLADERAPQLIGLPDIAALGADRSAGMLLVRAAFLGKADRKFGMPTDKARHARYHGAAGGEQEQRNDQMDGPAMLV